MSESLSRGELLQMATAIERGAETFYRGLAGKFKVYEKMFSRLADDERAHAETYVGLLGGKATISTEQDRSIALSHIRAMESMGAIEFLKTAGAGSKTDDLRSAVELAQKLEQNTLLLYQSLLLYFSGEDRNAIHKITEVEYIHLLQLSRIDYFE